MTISTNTNVKIEDLLKWHRGRGAPNIRNKQHNSGYGGNSKSFSYGDVLFPSASYGGHKSSTLSPRDKATGIVHNSPEAMVKVDKASKGIKSVTHLMTAANYISRDGIIDLEDENGQMLLKAELKDRMTEWGKSQDMPEMEVEGTKRPADARRLIFSCPKGSDPEAVKATVRELAKETFGSEGFSYVFGMHYKSNEMPNEPDHPHVHVLIKSVSAPGKRLNLRKEDLRYLRERFAVLAKEHGIELNATSRAQRGQFKKGKTQERIHQEEREWNNHLSPSHPYDLERMKQIDTALNSGTALPESEGKAKAVKTRQSVIKNAKMFISELEKSNKFEDVKLAIELNRYINDLPPLETSQEELLRKIREFKQQQRAKGYDIKEKIRQRKSKSNDPFLQKKNNSHDYER